MKFGRLSSGFKPRLAKAEPGRPVASLAAAVVRWRLMRRYANFWAGGNAAPKSVCSRLAQGLHSSEGSSVVTEMGEGAARLAECTTSARNTEDSPVTWETPVSPRERNGQRRTGPESPRPGTPADARAEPSRRSICSTGRLKRGEPKRRPMETRESEDRIRAMTLGKSCCTSTQASKGGPCCIRTLGGQHDRCIDIGTSVNRTIRGSGTGVEEVRRPVTGLSSFKHPSSEFSYGVSSFHEA